MNSRFSRINAHFQDDYFLPIRDPLWGNVYLSEALMALIQSLPFQQLARIKQLGPSHFVYPGATHSRLNHSIGVFHIAFRMLRHFLSHASRSDISGIGSYFQPEAAKAFLAAALLHDVGHFPYTHSLKELALKEHEELTAEIILDSEITSIIREKLGTDPEMVASIVDYNRETSDERALFFRKILSAPIDPDKLDYLTRDAYYCGVPYGHQDVDYVLTQLIPDAKRGVVLAEDGIAAVEALLFSKYLMYRAVYWHSRVRIATGMIKKSLFLGLAEGRIKSNQLYGLDDDSFYMNFATGDAKGNSLIARVYSHYLHELTHEWPFNKNDPAHTRLENLEQRIRAEKTLANELSALLGRTIHPQEVLLDIPEFISFEIQMDIRGESGDVQYGGSHSVFSAEVVEQFTSSLRKIRLALAPELIEDMKSRKISRNIFISAVKNATNLL